MIQTAQKHRSSLLFAGLLALITLISYFPALRGDFIWDDDRHVSNNHTLLSLHGLKHIWLDPQYLPQWYPLTHTSFWIEYRLFGLHPIGYHVDNALLHVINALLLWRLLRFLKIPGATLAATIFALHPIEVESVAWISERKNLLSTCFAILSIDTYLRSARWRNWAMALAFFLLAMLSKTVACSTPAVLLVLIAWRRWGARESSPSPGTPGEGGGEGEFVKSESFDVQNHPHPNPLPVYRERGSDVLRLMPFLIVGALLAAFTAWTESRYVGARGAEWNISFVDRGLIAARAVWFYAVKLVVPTNLMFSYPRWRIDSHIASLYLFPVALVGALLALWTLRKRFGIGCFASAVIFIGVLVPALGFINTYPMRYSFVADHFQYAAGIAMIVLASAGIVRVVPERVAIVVLAVPLAILTARQSRAYAGPESLWTDVIAKNPQSWLARQNLAVHWARNGRAIDALPLFAQVESLKPDDELLQGNWGDALTSLGRWNEAIIHYRAALSSPKADRSAVHDRIGAALQKLDRLPEAVDEFHLALSENGDNIIARMHLAEVLAAQGNDVESLAESDRVLQKFPDATEALAASAKAMLKLNRPNEAAERIARLVALQPADRKNRLVLARMYMQLHRPADAATQFSKLLDLNPNDATAKQGLLDALAKRGDRR